MKIFLLVIALAILIYLFWKWKNRAVLITHSGIYHPDDVFATAILSILLKRRKKFYQIIRTRDEKVLEKWRDERNRGREVYIYDVGYIYDEEKNEFDHHQGGGAGLRENGIEYSSAGLVWKKFGEEFMGSKNGAETVDRKIIMAIDALDNSQQVYDYRYDCLVYDIFSLFKTFTPLKKTKWRLYWAFLKSVKLAQYVLNKEVEFLEKEKRDEKIIRGKYQKAKDKRVLIFEDDQNISFNLLTEKYPEVLFLITKKDENFWTVETIVKKKGSFERRRYLPEAWAGLNNDDLEKVTGIKGCIFCHRKRFIASARSLEAAKKMVGLVLKEKIKTFSNTSDVLEKLGPWTSWKK